MKRNLQSKTSMIFIMLVLILFAIVLVFPLVYMLANSFMSGKEILSHYNDILHASGNPISFHLIPDQLSLEGFYQVFLRQPDYLMKFWNSLLISTCIVIGQLFVSCLAGYAFAKFRFPFRNGLFFIYIVFMMLPYLVTLLPNYMVLRTIGLLDNVVALILPGIFSPFGVFLMRQSIVRTPNEIIEAGKLDGARRGAILFKIVLPQCRTGIVALVILAFVDSWNMVEQPLIMLQDARKYPLSVFLTLVGQQRLDLLFVCGLLAMIPAVLLFLFFEDEFVSGIEYMGLQ